MRLGLVNISEDADFALGAASIVKNGRFHLDAWTHESGLSFSGIKHGGRYFIRSAASAFVDIDGLGYGYRNQDASTQWGSEVAQLRVVAGFSVTRRFALYAGPTYNVMFDKEPGGHSLSSWQETVSQRNADYILRGWPGVSAGVQFL